MKKKRRLEQEPPPRSLQEIPSSQHYQVSYLHRSIITQIAVSSKHDYILSASEDGIVKFWKRTPSSQKCLEFIKSYLAHVGPILTMITSANGGDHAASIGMDGCIKFYDVVSFDVTGMIRAKDILFPPSDSNSNSNSNNSRKGEYHCEAAFVTREQNLLAVSSRNSIHVFDSITLSKSPIQKISLHASSITTFQYSYERNCVLSADESGVLELWDCSLTFSSSSSSNTSSTKSPLENDDDNHHGENNETQNEGNKQQIISASHPTMAKNGIKYESKMDTDLYVFLKKKKKKKSTTNNNPTMTPACAIAIALSKDNFVVYSSERKILLFRFETAKLLITYDERIKVYDDAIFQKKMYNLDAMDYGKRAATECEINDSPILQPNLRRTDLLYDRDSEYNTHGDVQLQQLVIDFDATGRYLLIPTLLGIKVIDTQTHKCVKIIGKEDASLQRFITVALCTGEAKVDKQMELARAAADSSGAPPVSASAKSGSASKSSNTNNQRDDNFSDPLLISLSYQKKRLFVFSTHDPIVASGEDEEATNEAIISRDVLNEPPDPSDLLSSKTEYGTNAQSESQNILGKEAILRTTIGDIHFRLFGDLTPRTVENFCTHSRNGYYDDVIFHRIIKGFMIQTGDPLGDGTGGESIWGGEFEDEFIRE